MPDGMTRLRTYTNEIEAQLALNLLLSAGLVAVVQKDNCGGMRPHLDLHQGVRLLVADDDLDLARTIVTPQSPTLGERWVCSSCREENEGNFEICWNCGSVSV